jgi:hypothetical protein
MSARTRLHSHERMDSSAQMRECVCMEGSVRVDV